MARKPVDPYRPSRRPWHPTHYTSEDIHALQNLSKGQAAEHQQTRALEYIIEHVCGVSQPTFYPDSDRETVFAEAKRHVGLEIKKLIGFPPAVVKAMRDKEHNSRLTSEMTDE